MKVTDFKIGDLVNFGGEKAKVMGTSFIDKNSIAVQYLDGGKGIWGANLLDAIDGIPLTKEIFEKNGWIYRKDKLRWDGWKKNSLLLVQKKLHNTFTVFIENLADSIEFHNINYVHELQHILWVIGEDDNLTI